MNTLIVGFGLVRSIMAGCRLLAQFSVKVAIEKLLLPLQNSQSRTGPAEKLL